MVLLRTLLINVYALRLMKKNIFLVPYIHHILFAKNKMSLLYDTKQFLSQKFCMNDLSEASYTIVVEIHKDSFIKKKNYLKSLY